MISTSLSESKDNISLLNSSTNNTLLTNNIMSCAVCKKHYKSKGALHNHYGSKMHKQNLDKVEADSTSTISIETANQDNDNLTEIVSSQSHSHNLPTLTTKKPKVKREFKTKSSTLCLFSDVESEDIESNLIHMFTNHNFKIPFPDEVSNMHELLYYLHHKLNKLKLCMFCNKGFKSYGNLCRHMHDMNHCAMDVSDENPE